MVFETTVSGKWPALNSGKIKITDENGKVAEVTYSKQNVSIKFNDEIAVTKAWNELTATT